MEREERKQDEEEVLEKQVEGLSGSDEEIGEDEGNGYVQEGSSGDEGAGLPDTANDEVEGGSDVDMVD